MPRIVRLLALCVFTLSAPTVWAADGEPSGGDMAPLPAEDTSRADRLDALFADLKAASNLEDGRAIERDIIRLWLESGDAEVDRLMGSAIAAMNIAAYTLALDYLDVIVVTRPDYAEGWNKRATIYYLIDRFDDSLADIERTLALEPRHFGALAGLGMIMAKLGEKRRAITAFQAALDVNPSLEDVRASVQSLRDQVDKGI